MHRLKPPYRRRVAGHVKHFTIVTGLVDTNVLVSRFDPRFPDKQSRASTFLRDGIAAGTLAVPHQALVEFFAVVTRTIAGAPPLLKPDEAHREVEDMLAQFTVVYPTENTLRTALRGAALYRLPWFDAHLWAYADERGYDTLWSEDFETGRLYGRVQARNPLQ